MCTYNGDRYLHEQLESIATQVLLPHELVVCDDCSSDSTLQILEAFAQNAPFQVRIFRNEVNLGYVKNFEQAVRLCEGDAVALSDQDDIWYPQKLSYLSAFLQRDSSVGGVFSDGDLMDSYSRAVPGSLWNSFMFNEKERGIFRLGRSLEVLLRRNVVTGMTFMFRAELRHKVLPIPPSWEHDAWIAMMICLYSKLELSSNSLVRYRVHERQEIGVPLSPLGKLRWILGNGVPAFFLRARYRNVSEYKENAAKYDELLKHLMGQPITAINSINTKKIVEKGEHVHLALESLSRRRSRRFLKTLARAADYKSYSALGLRAMFRDMII